MLLSCELGHGDLRFQILVDLISHSGSAPDDGVLFFGDRDIVVVPSLGAGRSVLLGLWNVALLAMLGERGSEVEMENSTEMLAVTSLRWLNPDRANRVILLLNDPALTFLFGTRVLTEFSFSISLLPFIFAPTPIIALLLCAMAFLARNFASSLDF